MSSHTRKRVLVAPLDWGLGHATRCIPVIRELLKQECEVHIASSGEALLLLKEEFPALKFHELVPYNPAYSAWLSFSIKIILQVPKFLRVIREEHDQTEKLIEKEKIDVIISDNRYGCWSKKAKSVLITHQVNILLNPPWKIFSAMVNSFVHRWISNFHACWVPDVAQGITGAMSRTQLPVRFIGTLSRFEKMPRPIVYDVLAIVSGPEPQRSLFEKLLSEKLQASGLTYFLVKGKVGQEQSSSSSESEYLTAEHLNEKIESSSIVICRPGYSSIMDLAKLGKKAIFIPTPGQTEQEHLARELKNKNIAWCQSQQEFDLPDALEKSKSYSGFADFDSPPNLLPQAITDLLHLHA
jgi:hypothetical protein